MPDDELGDDSGAARHCLGKNLAKRKRRRWRCLAMPGDEEDDAIAMKLGILALSGAGWR